MKFQRPTDTPGPLKKQEHKSRDEQEEVRLAHCLGILESYYEKLTFCPLGAEVNSKTGKPHLFLHCIGIQTSLVTSLIVRNI